MTHATLGPILQTSSSGGLVQGCLPSRPATPCQGQPVGTDACQSTQALSFLRQPVPTAHSASDTCFLLWGSLVSHAGLAMSPRHFCSYGRGYDKALVGDWVGPDSWTGRSSTVRAASERVPLERGGRGQVRPGPAPGLASCSPGYALNNTPSEKHIQVQWRAVLAHPLRGLSCLCPPSFHSDRRTVGTFIRLYLLIIPVSCRIIPCTHQDFQWIYILLVIEPPEFNVISFRMYI